MAANAQNSKGRLSRGQGIAGPASTERKRRRFVLEREGQSSSSSESMAERSRQTSRVRSHDKPASPHILNKLHMLVRRFCGLCKYRTPAGSDHRRAVSRVVAINSTPPAACLQAPRTLLACPPDLLQRIVQWSGGALSRTRSLPLTPTESHPAKGYYCIKRLAMFTLSSGSPADRPE